MRMVKSVDSGCISQQVFFRFSWFFLHKLKAKSVGCFIGLESNLRMMIETTRWESRDIPTSGTPEDKKTNT